MDAAIVIGVAGLLTTGGTAIWVRTLDDRRHARQLTHDRAMVEQTELRPLLDEAAVLMRRVMWAQRKFIELHSGYRVIGLYRQGRRLLELVESASLMVGRLECGWARAIQ